MFQVLLCDDEPSVTHFLKENVPWESLGISEIYTASDGVEAMALLQQKPIDLLITDIRMPQMDGLTLLEKARAKYPDLHCILLTAYGEFEYAKTAFRLGVDNYLLKPIQLSELTATIENTVENLFVKRHIEAELFRENILRRWLNGSIGEDELGERTSMLENVNIYQSAYCAVCMTKQKAAVSLSAFVEQMRTLLAPEYDCLYVWDNQSHLVLIVGGHEIDRSRIAEALATQAKQLQILPYIRIAIGPVADQCMQLCHSFQAAVSCLDQLAAKDRDAVSCPNQHAAKDQDAVSCLNLPAAKGQDAVFRPNLPAAKGQDAVSCLDQLAAKGQGAAVLSHPVSCIYLVPENPVPKPSSQDGLTLPNPEALSPIIQKALEYIHKEYASGVSIKEFCAGYTITTAYLGYLFKKETGTFFNTYLNNYRLEKAADMLIHTQEKVNVIAEKTGFTSPSYFITSFKKYTGVSPQKYREMQISTQ